MSFASVYPLYVAKAERKGRSQEEVDQIIQWLTGYDQASLDGFRADYDASLDADPSSDYGYWLMEPQFELEDADFVWLDLFTDEAAAQSGADNWNGSALQTQWNDMVNCQNFTFAATAIRR